MKMNNPLNKIKFLLTKPKVVVIAGEGKETAFLAISQVLQRFVLIYQTDMARVKEAEFLLKNSRSAILVAIHADECVEKLAAILPAQAQLVLNFDDDAVRDIKNKSKARILSFGLGARGEIKASDIVLTQVPTPGTNFKINFEGNIVPVWLKNLFGKENIYAALASTAVGELSGLNLVEISNALKSYQGFPGRMKLIEGIKNTLILDDSESATPLSMEEALDIFKKLNPGGEHGRRIAVLGDIIGAGTYTPEIHEALGEQAKSAADVLFTVGLRAKFYAEGAKKKGFAPDKIFSFNEAAEAGLALQKEMKQGDLILIDGSKELQMGKIVDEVRNI